MADSLNDSIIEFDIKLKRTVSFISNLVQQRSNGIV